MSKSILWENPNVNKRVSSDLLIFGQFLRHSLKNRTKLYPTTSISVSEKIGMVFKKQAANFYFSFTWRSCVDFFFSAK